MPRAAPATTSRKAHMPALDGLRGVAIVGVLLFHAGRLPGGFLGVDLFFGLSGYLITDLLLRKARRSGTVSLVGFWGRRARRLLPALVTMLAIVTFVVWAVEPADVVRTTLADGPWVQIDLINWHLLAESASYWDRFGDSRVFEHLWSVAVEEQFYLVWPLVILAATHCRPSLDRLVAAIAVLGSITSAVLMLVLLDPADPTRVYTGTDTRAFSLLLGALFATSVARGTLLRAVGRYPGAASAALAVALGATWALADGMGSTWLYRGGLLVYAFAAGALICLCAEVPGTAAARSLSWRPLRWLGLISYSLYLWHWPVFVLLPPVPGFGPWPETALLCAVSIALAALSKYLIEDPVRFRADWARGGKGALAFTVAMVGLAALWLLLPSPPAPHIDLRTLR